MFIPRYSLPKIWQDYPDEQLKFISKTAEFDLKQCFPDDLSVIGFCARVIGQPTRSCKLYAYIDVSL